MIIKNNITPINIKYKDKKAWCALSSYISNAYIFSNRDECLKNIKEIIEHCKSRFERIYVYVIIKLDSIYPSFNSESYFTAFDMKYGSIIAVDICNVDDIVPYLYRYWGYSQRIQLFFSYYDKEAFIDMITKISKKYLNSFDSYYSVINKCELIISDSGDGDELELICPKTEDCPYLLSKG